MIDPLDVRHLPYMPLYLERLRRSKAWLRCKRRPEIAFYLMNLWLRAYHEFPAGSVENDEDVLADAAMCDPAAWTKVRADVLRGWIEQDGRLYHPVVLEVATEAIARLRGKKDQTEAARKALAELRAKGQSSLDLCQASATGSVTDDEGKGEGEGNREEKSPAPHSTTAGEPSGAAPSLEEALNEAAGAGGKIRTTGLSDIRAILDKGASLDRHVLPAIRAVREAGRRGSSWSYYLGAIRERLAGADLAAGAGPQVAIVSVWVQQDSPEGRAWAAFHEAEGRPPPVWRGSRHAPGQGHSMPTRWPPGHPNQYESAGAAA